MPARPHLPASLKAEGDYGYFIGLGHVTHSPTHARKCACKHARTHNVHTCADTEEHLRRLNLALL